MLNKDEIKSAKIIENAVDAGYRDVSYDICVGKIIDGKGDLRDEYNLQPQGMVKVVSTERLNVPDTVAGYAMVKTQLCNAGLLAINIGIIDPGYAGPLSSTLINFGRDAFPIKKGTVFLRIGFHKVNTPLKPAPPPAFDDDAYLAKSQNEVLRYTTESFLNLHGMAEAAGAKAFGNFKDWLVVWAGVLALVLAIFAVVVPLGVNYIDRRADAAARYEVLAEQLKQLQQTVNHKVDQGR